MTDRKELIVRLREALLYDCVDDQVPLTDVAADALEAAEAEIARLRKLLTHVHRLLNGPGYILREHQAIASIGAGIIPEVAAAIKGPDAEPPATDR
jgi:hypothetical protein